MKVKTPLLIVLTVLTFFFSSAQIPQGFTYQSILRDSSGNPLSDQVNLPVRIKIFQGADSVYTETFTASTNQFGLLTLTVGQGTPVQGVFSGINWTTGNYSMKVEINFGSGYEFMGNNSLLTVPFAMIAKNITSDAPGNLFAGLYAGNANTYINDTTGNWNTFFGSRAGLSNTVGSFNVAVGSEALYTNANSVENTAVGMRALYANTSGDANTGVGRNALYANTTGNSNTAIGVRALSDNVGGFANTAGGRSTMTSNTSGSNNTAFGRSALLTNTTGSNNVAVGVRALYNSTTQSNLVAVGDSALFNNGVGATISSHSSSNTAVGSRSLANNSTGSQNTALGYRALLNNTNGIQNTAIGNLANTSTGSLTNATAIGNSASVNASNKVRIGNGSVTVIEGQVNWSFPSDGRFKINVQENVPGLSFISLLRPVTYNFENKKFQSFLGTPDEELNLSEESYSKADAQIRSGFLAQDVEQACKAIGYSFNGLHVPENEHDNYSISYADFVPSLVKALQEQQEIIINQQNLIEALLRSKEETLLRLEKIDAMLGLQSKK